MGTDRDLFESDDEALEERARHDRGNPFADAAEAAERRGRGRPPGAINLKTRDFERYYTAMGYRDPLKAMAEFLTADPVALQAWFEEHEKAQIAVGKSIRTALPQLLDIIKEQHACAVALAPYLHGKKPVQVEIIDERLPSLIIDLGTNQLDQARQLAADRALSVGPRAQIEGDGEPDPASNEINDLDEGE